VFQAHRKLYHSTLGLRVIKKKKCGVWIAPSTLSHDSRRWARACGRECERVSVCERVSACVCWGLCV